MHAHIRPSREVFPFESKFQPENLPFSAETWQMGMREEGMFFEFDKDQLASKPRLEIRGLRRFLSISRYNTWWVTPKHGKSCPELDRDSVCFLWEDEGGLFHVLLPLLDGNLLGALIGSATGLSFCVSGPLKAHPRDTAHLLYGATGLDPIKLVADAVAKIAERLGTFQLRADKPQPVYADLLGWCTWDAFYQDVSEDGVLAGLEGLRSSGMVPPLLILDDGWQDSHELSMRSFRAHPEKFPHGLKSLVQRAKKEFGVKMFGVWHTLQGYWGGVHPDGVVGKAYPLISNTAALYPDWEKWAERKRFIVSPSAAHSMFRDWYADLKAQGVDMVKVDSQASHSVFLGDDTPLVGAMREYHSAAATEASKQFAGNLLNCMSNTLDIAYQSGASVMWRNSEDYSPNKPVFHQEHVFMNAMNNVWAHTFSCPDWDMFQTHDNHAEFLAASRAISGSPIYVSDKPGKSDINILRKLSTTGGSTLRCPQPALPAQDILFVDCHREPVPLKIVNRNGEIGFIGLFHCFAQNGKPSERTLTGDFAPADVPDLVGETFAVWHYRRDQKLGLLREDAKQTFELASMEFDLVTLSPVADGFAPIGLIEKFNPAAALSGCERGDGHWTVWLRDGGRVGFYSSSAPHQITDGSREVVEFEYCPETGLLVCEVPEGGPVSLVIHVAQ